MENETNEKLEIKGVPTHEGKYVEYNVLGNFFEVTSKYIPPIQPVGRGAYGMVWYFLSTLFVAFSLLHRERDGFRI